MKTRDMGWAGIARILLVLGAGTGVAQAQTGACCEANGICSQTSQNICSIAGGAYSGDGTSCEEVDCFGACCFEDGSCEIQTEVVCIDNAGIYAGGGSTCASCPGPLGNAFTYQGQLKQAGIPSRDPVKFRFSLWNAEVDGARIGSNWETGSVTPIDGLFTVKVDFGPGAFDGDARWLEIAVKSPPEQPDSEYVTLSPRQPITPAPYAVQTRGLFVNDTGNVGIGTTMPGAKLEVAGDIKIADGSQGAGKVLTSDANGVASWQTPGAPSSVYRWATFSTFDNSDGWLMDNDADMFGGRTPNQWTDGAALASEMSGDKEVLRTLFTRKGYGGKNAAVIAETYHTYSSTNGRVAAALFRIKNTTASAINWPLQFRYTCYRTWGERASVTLNGENSWDSFVEDSGVDSSVAVDLSIPPNRTSTVIVVSTSDSPYVLGGAGTSVRTLILAFINNSLELPPGLEYVDDLDTATGGWED
ncbi:MAG: hypothetical protein ACYTFA_01135 [Planctomycetota bacterium]